MNRKTLLNFIIFLLLISALACAALPPTEPATEKTPTASPTIQVPTLQPPTPSLSPSETPGWDLAAMAGPLLLLQTNFDEYLFLEPKSQTSISFEPPISNPQFRLRANLSPSGKLMFFPGQDGAGVIIDLQSGEVVHTYNFSGPALFIPKQAAIEAGPLVTELELTETGLQDAVTEAHQRSRQLLRWYQSDRYHLSVQDTGPASTSLFLDDHQTGTRLQLEDQPGFVEDYHIGPDRNLVLLKKGFVFWPGAYRDKAYYLLNIQERSIQPVTLPEDISNPTVTWFTQDTIGVIHQATNRGGSGFSLIDIKTFETQTIITGEFGELHQFGDHLLLSQRHSEPETTTFQLVTLAGEYVTAQTVNQQCFRQHAVSDRIILQCEQQSFLLDQDLNFDPFYDSVLTLWPAPNRNTFLMINRSEQSFMLDENLELQGELFLEEPPLEIFWLPDSTGFLYRTHGKLFFFDLQQKTSHLLIESDLFSDYTNLNAVWVNPD
ncbi:MAG: hypothetical protein ACNA70_05460 [Brevefilum sp.]